MRRDGAVVELTVTTWARETEESPLLETVARERLLKTQQAGKRLTGCRGDLWIVSLVNEFLSIASFMSSCVVVTFVVLGDSSYVSWATVRGITQHYKLITHARIKQGKIWNCIHWRKCSSFQRKFSKHLMTISVETHSARVCMWDDELRSENKWRAAQHCDSRRICVMI
jgi:hypothetical protein